MGGVPPSTSRASRPAQAASGAALGLLDIEPPDWWGKPPEGSGKV